MTQNTAAKHTENPETSWLFNGFLALAIGWLMLTALVGSATVHAANAEVGGVAIISE